jgi:hypothetical protein
VLKVNPPDEYPPEKGRYARGNDFSPVALCVILDTFDFNIPPELEELLMAGLDAGAALSGMLQTENIGLEKMICNIVANPNIRYIVLCGREAAGHLPGQSILCLMESGVDEKRRIVGSKASPVRQTETPRGSIPRQWARPCGAAFRKSRCSLKGMTSTIWGPILSRPWYKRWSGRHPSRGSWQVLIDRRSR